MEWLESAWSQMSVYISIPYLLIFMLLSYFVKKNFEDLLEKITVSNWRTVYTVLVIATLTAIPFILFTDEGWMKILFSYAVGTSLWELIFSWLDWKVKVLKESSE